MLNREPPPPRPIPVRPDRSRRILPWLVGIFLVLLLGARGIATFWTDYLWYDSVDLTGVWSTLLWTRVLLVVVAAIVAFVLMWGSLALADRLSPRRALVPGSPDEEVLIRFQEWIEPRVRRVRLLVSAFFGLMLGLGASAWWEDYLQFRNAVPFGTRDPVFDNDLSLYVFELPFYRDLFGWVFQLFLVIALVTAAVHYLNGAIQVGSGEGAIRRVGRGVKIHLSILFAVLALIKAFGYQLDRWDLLYSGRGQVIGASYTDVNAQDPALRLLILISVVAAVILIVNLRFVGWRLPLVALGLWLVTSIVVGGVYPTIVQRFTVVPDEVNKEREFVAHNIEFTRRAFGLDAVEVREFAASPGLTAADIAANTPTIDNLRLWDPGVLRQTYRELQEIRTFYGIEDIDVDRYVLDGELTQVMVAARSLDEDNIPGGGWVNEKLVYTHGFGAVVSSANAVSAEGQPDFILGDIPPVTSFESLQVSEPRIYFSDSSEFDYSIAGTKQREVDFPIGQTGELVEYTNYTGPGGIRLGGFFRRAAFALRFANLDTLISGQLTAESKVLMVRNVKERVLKAAPLLKADDDPYLVVLDGRLVWVVDLYTISDRYPYGTPADTRRLDATIYSGALPDRFNYIRNSVKATVDAHDGTMTFYVIDPADPLIRVQRQIFPELFTTEELPDDLRAHLRYPEDLFRVQSDMYRLYHQTDPEQFFSNVDPWQIAQDPSNSPRDDTRYDFERFEDVRPMLPYYLLIQLPGDDELSFLIMQPFTPRERPNMVAFLVAKSGPEEYGRLIDFNLPADSALDGPGQVGKFINQDPDISPEFTLLGQGGSKVIQGNMLVVPIEESLLYVQPIYVAASQSGQTDEQGIPEFKRVVVSFNNQIEMRETLAEALAAVFGTSGGEPPPPDDDGEIPADVAGILARAEAAFEAADRALTAGDLAEFQRQIERARRLLGEAQRVLAELGT